MGHAGGAWEGFRLADIVEEESKEVSGHVKWFDATRGFGFVLSDAVERDILLHVNVLRNFGQSSIAEGSLVQLRVVRSSRGFQALEILSIQAPEAVQDDAATDVPEFLRSVDDDVPYEPARVKWFDKGKGFGFANVFGNPEDVFIHAEVLRRCGLADLAPGEAVCIRSTDGQRGRLAVEVRPWEHFSA
ncbi:cold shock domain-containing protein [Jannaschia sp. LMIT008]|uniref:cold-shock protein n=1 Tax=Jannaschia maritima TaxID=3032585 RepID=UPI0028117DFB|nr:cold shock domain-containing protein [Jannaschia sp. LMIT008]